MKFRGLALMTAMLAMAASCVSVQNIPYFQDLSAENVDTIITATPIVVRPDDKLSIIVNCPDPELSSLFNLPYITKYLGQTTQGVLNSYSQGVSGYLVGPDGCIDFPVVGKLEVAGKTRPEVQEFIKNELVSRNLVKDPIVTVDYMNLSVSVMGEVNRPGRISIDKDRFTLLDALSAAGDLTIYGKRENIKVQRSENGVMKTYFVNLCSAKDILASPVYYMQQNDIIYVEPNDVRARQSTVNGNNLLSTSFWMSVASLAVTISYYFFRP